MESNLHDRVSLRDVRLPLQIPGSSSAADNMSRPAHVHYWHLEANTWAPRVDPKTLPDWTIDLASSIALSWHYRSGSLGLGVYCRKRRILSWYTPGPWSFKATSMVYCWTRVNVFGRGSAIPLFSVASGPSCTN